MFIGEPPYNNMYVCVGWGGVSFEQLRSVGTGGIEIEKKKNSQDTE